MPITPKTGSLFHAYSHLCVMVYWSWPTLYIAISGVAFFSTISFFGLTLPAMLRLTRRVLVGKVRTAVPVWNRRRLA